jgi:hypothetical protein
LKKKNNKNWKNRQAYTNNNLKLNNKDWRKKDSSKSSNQDVIKEDRKIKKKPYPNLMKIRVLLKKENLTSLFLIRRKMHQ